MHLNAGVKDVLDFELKIFIVLNNSRPHLHFWHYCGAVSVSHNCQKDV